MRHFRELVQEQWDNDRHICVGLDVDPNRIPEGVPGETTVERCQAFLEAIVEATREHAAAFKPNLSFFEALGPAGIPCLRAVINYIHSTAPSLPVIADAKRGDIASTNNGYVTAIYDFLKADAITLHPYLGREAMAPFLDRAEKGCFILCRTSNPGAAEFQDLDVKGEPLYLRVARVVASDWNLQGNCGLVAGATFPEELAHIRERVPDLPLLVPGVGAQGGSVERMVRAASIDGVFKVLVNSSRGILYADGSRDFAAGAEAALLELNTEVVSTLRNLRGGLTQ